MKAHRRTQSLIIAAGLAVFSSLTATVASAAAQLEETWSAEVQSPVYGARVNTIIPHPGGGVVTGNVTSSGPGLGETLTATRFTENGEVLWTFSRDMSYIFDSSNGGRQPLDVDSSGATYLTFDEGAGTRLVKLGPTGALTWDVPVSSSAVPVFGNTSVAVDSMDRPVVVGTTDINLFPFVGLFQFDAAGNLSWSTGGAIRGAMTGIKLLASGNIALYGSNDYPSFGFANSQVQVYDSTGAWIWSRLPSVFARTVGDLVVGAQDDLWTMSNHTAPNSAIQVHRFSATGATIFDTNVGTGLAVSGCQVALDSAQNLYVAGSQTSDASLGFKQASLWKLNSAGGLEWLAQDVVPHTGRSTFTAIGLTDQGHAFVTGHWRDHDRDLQALYDEAGNGLWRREQSGALAPLDSLCDGVTVSPGGQIYCQQPSNDRLLLTKFVSGGPIGLPYCGQAVPNSTGVAGAIEAVGSILADDGNVSLRILQLPPDTFAFVINGSQQANMPGAGGGQGTICVGGSIGRHIGPGEIRRTGADGTSSLRLNTGALPDGTAFQSAMAGQVWHFQCWYRDANPGQTSNLTNAVQIGFQ